MGNETFLQLRLDRQWTQEQVAKAVRERIKKEKGHEPSFDSNAVSRLERGLITWPNREYREALCRVFGVATEAELGLFSKQTRRHHDEVSKSKRRDFMSMSLAGVLPESLRLPSRVGLQDVHAIVERTHALEEWDRQTGGGATRHFAFSELRAAVDFTKASMGPSVRKQLCGAIADLADLAGWASFDSGLMKDSRPAFRLGMEAARESGDHGTLAHIATNLARQEIHERNPDQALALADMSLGDIPVPALAMVAAVKAQAFALRGDEAQVMRQISLAESIYGRVVDLRGEPRWTWCITGQKLHSDVGYALYLLSTVTGRYAPDLLSRLRQAVDAPTTAQARAKAMASTRLATVLYRQGVLDEAGHHARTAAGLATTVSSARLDGALVDMRQAARLSA